MYMYESEVAGNKVERDREWGGAWWGETGGWLNGKGMPPNMLEPMLQYNILDNTTNRIRLITSISQSSNNNYCPINDVAVNCISTLFSIILSVLF